MLNAFKALATAGSRREIMLVNVGTTVGVKPERPVATCLIIIVSWP